MTDICIKYNVPITYLKLFEDDTHYILWIINIMRNIHNPNEYHAYKSTTDENKNTYSRKGPNGPCKVTIVIVIVLLILFIIKVQSLKP